MAEPARATRSLIRIDWRLRRVWFAGFRFHHAHAGLLLVLQGIRWIVKDWHDRWWTS